MALDRGGCYSARERSPSRPHSTAGGSVTLDSIVLASGAGFRKLGGCPGYRDPWPRRSNRRYPRTPFRL